MISTTTSHPIRICDPYARLIRLYKPIGVIIIHFPYVVGSLYAACISSTRISLQDLIQINALLFCGTFLLRSWACAWNDIADRDLDKLVERCKSRPMAAGEISVRNACVFTGVLCLAWLALMQSFIPSFWTYGVPLTVLCGVYPLTKRVTAYTPVFLGITFAWGIFAGCAATYVDPVQLLYSEEQESKVAAMGLLLLFCYYTIWTVVFETVYSFQDLKDDMKVGINSMAVLYQSRIHMLLGTLGVAQVVVLLVLGTFLEASSSYYLGAPMLNAAILFRMVTSIDFGNAKECGWWFGNGPLMAGISMVVSLHNEYLKQLEKQL